MSYLDPGSGSILGQALIAFLLPIAIFVFVLWLFLRAIGEVRKAVDRNTRTVEQQTRLLEYIAKRQGVLPPDAQVPIGSPPPPGPPPGWGDQQR